MQQMYLPPLTKVNKYLIGILVVSFVLGAVFAKAFDISLVAILGLDVASLKSGLIYKMVTYPLVSTGLFNVVFTGLLFWFLGSDLEARWGSRRYIHYLLIATFVNAFAYSLFAIFMGGASLNYPFHGMAFLSSAMCVSYAVIYPDRIFQFFMIIPVKAKYFCLILAGMNVYQGFFSPGGAQAFGNIASMIFGAAFVFGMRGLGFYLRDQVGNLKKKQGKVKKKRKGHLRLVDDEEKPNPDEPRYWQ
ncbi:MULTISPECIES: rhomboid family intramembrane serine protease [Halobacteriovorax]|uniref:Rhomboid family intramembrane serine protease n=1 Tax=Halobacteriovorax vibrionivorans TaxID=2152716 RepID=A0ABY0IEN5_9BACT|nr:MULTISPECIES: rhomboid family intramembrane serine protease [Halobacteriovorax]AYF44887.1 peptidase, S54 family [Halobacteriovorax sp. BALOs_7]RZF20960.1 rhomboid family intramembrane serine protease [Halobacteriovorax vibrionivorans]TGD46805.1 rhomboid family intramembrane serine protease [Halobacteriovorax sp. Y22]